MPFLQFPESSYSSIFIFEINLADSNFLIPTLRFQLEACRNKAVRVNAEFEFLKSWAVFIILGSLEVLSKTR